MENNPASTPLAEVHFPRQIGLIKKLRVISFFINDTVLVISLLLLFFLGFDILGITSLILQQQIKPITMVLFILAAIPLFFGAKQHLITTHHNAEKEIRPWWEFGIPIFFALSTALGGLIYIFHFIPTGIMHIAPFSGICFFLIGLSLIPPYTRILHRFHITQFLIFIVSGLNVFVIFEHIFQYFSPLSPEHLFTSSILLSVLFVLFSLGILFRWSNRGFMGNFTLESTVSVFALRVFLLNLFSAPCIALFVLFLLKQSHYNMYILLTIIVICFAFVSSLLLWLNVKILYGHELEHIMMRESLRSHNIDLTKEQEGLQQRLEHLEQEKQEYVEKLTSQNNWQNAAERLG